MASCKYVLMKYPQTKEAREILENLQLVPLISCVTMKRYIIIARYGVNKTTLKKILAKGLRG